MSEISNFKRKFVRNEISTSSIIGAFEHNKIYKEVINEKQRDLLKQYIKNILLKREDFYKTEKDPDDHIREIIKIKNEISKRFSPILNDDEIKLGTVQKLLNLYLKYLWVFDYIHEPPHCPIDGAVIKELRKNANKDLPNWTKINTEEDYRKCVEAINKIRGKESIACWELKFWNDTIIKNKEEKFVIKNI